MRFICDVMLGKLARYLRILGFDAVYARNDAVLEHYEQEPDDYVFLTRRTGGIRFPKAVHIRSELVREQLGEIRGLIRSSFRPEEALNRCVECNSRLIPVEKTEIESLVPEFVYHQYEHFKQCPSCRRVYWEGSHTRGMDLLLREILA